MKEKLGNAYLESEKKKVRHKFLILRNKLAKKLILSYSVSVFAKIKNFSMYKKAKTVMFYLSCASEVVTDFMVSHALSEGKTVVVPAIKNPADKKMYAVKFSNFKNIYQSTYGIRQPVINANNTVEKTDIELVFIPGVVFDVNGYRIGYGKGYYDRWLKDMPFDKTVGLAYNFQVVDKLPIKKHDLPVGFIITEQIIIKVDIDQGA
jgi:5-formyltetrahydrofolate cyclo-ligase